MRQCARTPSCALVLAGLLPLCGRCAAAAAAAATAAAAAAAVGKGHNGDAGSSECCPLPWVYVFWTDLSTSSLGSLNRLKKWVGVPRTASPASFFAVAMRVLVAR